MKTTFNYVSELRLIRDMEEGDFAQITHLNMITCLELGDLLWRKGKNVFRLRDGEVIENGSYASDVIEVKILKCGDSFTVNL